MRKILGFLTLALIIFLVVYRQRIYLRDPLGAFYRDGAKQNDALIFINYSNDVLVESGEAHTQQYLIQRWDDGVPGKPEEIPCLHKLVCLAARDHALVDSWSSGKKAEMTNRQVTFTDGEGKAIRIVLR